MTQGLDALAQSCHQNAVDHGFYDSDIAIRISLPPALEEGHTQNEALKRICLIGTELSEMAEAVRSPRRADHIRKNPVIVTSDEFTLEEEEAADVLIRLLDYCVFRQIRLEEAVQAKMAFNKTREYKHGKLS